jgi:hypothetical protein
MEKTTVTILVNDRVAEGLIKLFREHSVWDIELLPAILGVKGTGRVYVMWAVKALSEKPFYAPEDMSVASFQWEPCPEVTD